ncbi:MAG: putative selenate ABC transporter substrate-binding protein [Cyanobacteriota bacterium]
MAIRERLTAVLTGLSLSLLPAVTAAPLALSPLLPQPAAALPSTTRPVLRIGAIPDQRPEKLNRLYGLVAQDLSQQLGVDVQYVPVTDYTAAITAFRTGNLDLVWFGGLTGVQARLQKPGARVLAQRDIDAAFHSVFIASTASGLKQVRTVNGLVELKGRRFTFGSESSTSGRLMPQYYLGKAGVRLTDFAGGAPGFSGSHDATIALVQSGAYDAGAVNEQVWKSNLREGKAKRDRVFVLWRTPGYPDYHWIAQPGLDQRFGKDFTSRLQKAILNWKPTTPERKQILSLFGAQQFTTADAADYGQIEQIGRQIGRIR